MDLFLIHCLLLLWASLLAARAQARSSADRLLVAALLAWGNLVATSLLLAAGHRLDERGWFLGLSAGLAGLTWLVLRKTPPEPVTAAEARPHPWLVGGFVLTLAPLAFASAAVAFYYDPNNPAALAYQLPRVLYYLGQGSLAHFEAADPRQTHLPFNYNLIQLLGLVYSAPLKVLNFFNLTAWMLGGLAIYRLCRTRASSVNASLVASWFALMVPPVLAQAASTTPDLAVGAALSGTLLFAQRWRQTTRRSDALLAGLAAGLAAGSDGRAFVLIGLVGLFALASQWRAWLAPTMLAGAIALPFALINLAAHGSAVTFPWRTSGLSAALQEWFMPAGPLNEDGAGFGLAGALCLLAVLVALARDRKAAGVWWGLGWILIALLLPCWSPASPRDLVPAMFLLSPGLAMMIDLLQIRPAALRLAGSAVILSVALVTSRSAAFYLAKNTGRPLTPLLQGNPADPAPLSGSLSVKARLAQQTWVNVDTDGMDEPILPVLSLLPGQRFTSGRKRDPAAYHLISRWGLSRFLGYADLPVQPVYVMLPVSGKPTAGVEFLSTVGWGASSRDYFGLAAGTTPTSLTSAISTALIMLSPGPRSDSGPARARLRLVGLNPEDGLEVRASLKLPDGTLERLATLRADGEAVLTPARSFDWLVFQAMDIATGRELGNAALPYHAPVKAEPLVDPTAP